MAMQSDGEAEIDQSVDNTLIHVVMRTWSARRCCGATRQQLWAYSSSPQGSATMPMMVARSLRHDKNSHCRAKKRIRQPGDLGPDTRRRKDLHPHWRAGSDLPSYRNPPKPRKCSRRDAYKPGRRFHRLDGSSNSIADLKLDERLGRDVVRALDDWCHRTKGTTPMNVMIPGNNDYSDRSESRNSSPSRVSKSPASRY